MASRQSDTIALSPLLVTLGLLVGTASLIATAFQFAQGSVCAGRTTSNGLSLSQCTPVMVEEINAILITGSVAGLALVLGGFVV